MNKFSPEVNKQLLHYVYTYSDPLNGEIFYVGKGQNNRCFQHLKETKESHKNKKILDLLKQNLKPNIEIIAHGLDEEAAFKVEAAIIDALGFDNLANMQKGHGSKKFGRKSVQNIEALYSADMITIKEQAIGFVINKYFRFNISTNELYNFTRGFWRLNKARAENAKLALSIYEGVIQEVYEINGWYKAGSTQNPRPYSNNKKIQRYEFTGILAEEKVREQYRFKRINLKLSQNPVRYFNI